MHWQRYLDCINEVRQYASGVASKKRQETLSNGRVQYLLDLKKSSFFDVYRQFFNDELMIARELNYLLTNSEVWMKESINIYFAKLYGADSVKSVEKKSQGPGQQVILLTRTNLRCLL